METVEEPECFNVGDTKTITIRGTEYVIVKQTGYAYMKAFADVSGRSVADKYRDVIALCVEGMDEAKAEMLETFEFFPLALAAIGMHEDAREDFFQ